MGKTIKLSNEVYLVNDLYRTSETRIGTWIDGKPLYRRVDNTLVSLPANTWTNLRYRSGENCLIRCLVSENDNFQYMSNHVAIKTNGNYLQVYSSIALTIKSVLVEYTKTID